MKVSASTEFVGPAEKISFWVDLVCAHLVQVDCRSVVDRERFCGSVTKLAVSSNLDIAQISAGGQNVQRTTEQISRATAEYFLVNIQRTGQGTVRQDGREAVLKPGDFALYSSTRPYELTFEDSFDQTVLILPAEPLRRLNHQIDESCAVVIKAEQAISKLLVGMVDGLYATATELPPTVLTSAADTVAQTLIAITTPGVTNWADIEHSRLSRYHVARIKQFVQHHLHDPQLSVHMIASGIGLSASHLHRVFADESVTVMEWVWSQRLNAAKCDLLNPKLSNLQIGEIAFRCGFNDCSHFSKAFRTRFGVSPSEIRRAL